MGLKETSAKLLGIKLGDPNAPPAVDKLTRGESVFSITSADTDVFVEDEPSVGQYVRDIVPTPRDVGHYFYRLFPFIQWIPHYNLQWLAGDLVAGITVGAVVVPQGMAYALLADLKPQFGLYSSFMGVLIYWFFATSKDITIGPVAVLSTVTGNELLKLAKTHKNIPGHVFASAIAVIAGAIVTFLGLIRFGFIIELIPLPAISAFMTGSALSIGIGQIPSLMGILGINSRAPTYQVVVHILKHLGRTKLDAAMGLTALFLLYAIRFVCNQLAKRLPKWRKTIFFINTLRTVFVILLYTMISWLVNRHHRKKPLFKILSTVPRGFQNIGVPVINQNIIKAFASKLPVIVVVMLIEHIAISKSFGRVNNYRIDPSQEMVAIGVTNIFGPFFGAYPATGSFSRTAIKSKAGVRTPFAGVITAVVVLLAIYALTAVFFYIPSASLSAVIIHAVFDLITPPNTLYRFWRAAPTDAIIFLIGVLVIIFSSIENGIYTTVAVSAWVYFWRLVKAHPKQLGKLKIHSIVGDQHLDSAGNGTYDSIAKNWQDKDQKSAENESGSGAPYNTSRHLFLPIDHTDGSNPALALTQPAPGVFIYRFSEDLIYVNAFRYMSQIANEVLASTRRTNPNTYARLGDRPWNDPAPRKIVVDATDNRPTLRALILDFSAVGYIDATVAQELIDVRNQLDRHAQPDHVEWHFAGINNRWTKRSLASAGFGYPSNNNIILEDGTEVTRRWKPIFDVAQIGGDDSAAADAERREQEAEVRRQSTAPRDDIEAVKNAAIRTRGAERFAVVNSVNRPFFHPDLDSALSSVLENLQPISHIAPKAGQGIIVEEDAGKHSDKSSETS